MALGQNLKMIQKYFLELLLQFKDQRKCVAHKCVYVQTLLYQENIYIYNQHALKHISNVTRVTR